ncbi:RluA family pseudouridine synthase [Tenacibaculum finnmarkense genomovar finnmarkense]|uniref:RluA family pseudouridine synthase n=1 Tax=Tenacibaculum finnmarkense TaxID=2781243 RepID=UPI001E358B98|nr:RluA family pseudouridine synthase [Tenacibaculum finnmarkense]MCD8417395.1 RluA family pseudouridine synthase [Tenacibaculum finnmarkense genomovar finnmarkense]MCG8185710.1 RluA family pseudouridine synthase [Tenacibaculum finnmarkense genomovar finnmarkense]MCG8202263.1 RluA family pseudouridine synthase [Tenacibaculum finnmarkense genomovar finnmarkense]MCG8209733.1 RluA family pseudouridine synthase [Tenacibaculum finnmarkense genomovar finnmarkense]MCG8212463.1 RluA family pseudouridi
MTLSETHKVPLLENPIRLQEYGVGIFKTIPTKSGIKKALKKNLIFVDKKIATSALFITGNEKIELYKIGEDTTFKHFDFPLEIIFEDALLQNIKKSPLEDAVRPRPVHRLDYPTSGLLLVGKTSSSIIALNKLFEDKEIQKTYHAVTIGKIENNGIIDFPIDDKKAETSYKLIKSVISERFKMLNLVELTPKTGRKHQLRKHLLAINSPILGDKEHFLDGFVLNGKGLYLHASSLQFEHPFTKKELFITKELPKKFKKIISLPTCE